MNKTIIYPLLDGKGFVELINSMGTDLTVANASRVSRNKYHDNWNDADTKLINFLFEMDHGSPLEHCSMQFRVKAPLFVRSQWERHRIASYNEQSGRWTPFEPEFYIQAGDEEIADHCDESYSLYQKKLNDGWSKEDARVVLPQNLYTTFYFTINLRSLCNFLQKRNADDAQHQIRAYASAVEEIFADLFPMTYAAFVGHGRKAP
jgi:thymidylate synthase (FAD)